MAVVELEHAQKHIMLNFKLSDFTEKFFYLKNEPFSLTDYPHMRLIYDIDPTKLVLHTSRQVAKCRFFLASQRLSNGKIKLVKDLQVGDELLSFDEDNQKIIKNKIKNIEPNGDQLIYKIKTRTGRIAEVTGEHPFWTLSPEWTTAKNLQVGDLIGLSKNNEVALPTEKTIPDYEYIILGHLLSEGGLSTNAIKYTNSEKINSDELNDAINLFESVLELREYTVPGQFTVCFKYDTEHEHLNPLKQWLIDLNLMGKKSDTKFHPPLIYKLTKEQLQDYLRIWWNTDGYVSIAGRASLPDIGIALISKELIDGLQELLLRLGIHTCKSIQKQPKVYEGTLKQVYKLRVEGAESVERFYELIHTRKLKPYSKKQENNNRLVIPKNALQPYFNKLKKQYYGNLKNTRHNHGWTQWALPYDLTYSKLKELKENLNDDYLKIIYDADIIYDRIVDIEILPPVPTISIEMESPHNTFLVDNLVTHNSTTLANIMLAKSILMPYTNPKFKGGFKTLAVLPTVEQVRIFSYDRVDTVIEQSPIFKKYFISNSMAWNVFQKRFLNGSVIYLRYGSATADRIRGISADTCYIDETQDIPDDNIDVIEMTMARSIYKHSIYAGTPKHIIGPLASRWSQSTKNEWIAKCEHCGKHNYLDEENIQPWGLACRYCRLSLDARNGLWVRTDPESTRSDETGEYLFEGFRVSVLMFAHAEWVNWQTDVYLPYQTKSRGIFFNEYLGIPFDAGVAPVTEEEIKACCTGGPMQNEPNAHIRDYPLFMGMDWGPINSEMSKTLMSILQQRGDMTEVVYLKKYEGKESDYAFLQNEVPKEFYRWGCQLLGADAGFGEAINSEIRAKLHDPNRLIAFQHVPNQKQKAQYNQHIRAYTLSRNMVMTDLFTKIKNRKIIFPQWSDFRPFAQDILSIAIEYNEEKNSYKYIKGAADDTFHSILYGSLVVDLHRNVQASRESATLEYSEKYNQS